MVAAPDPGGAQGDGRRGAHQHLVDVPGEAQRVAVGVAGGGGRELEPLAFLHHGHPVGDGARGHVDHLDRHRGDRAGGDTAPDLPLERVGRGRPGDEGRGERGGGAHHHRRSAHLLPGRGAGPRAHGGGRQVDLARPDLTGAARHHPGQAVARVERVGAGQHLVAVGDAVAVAVAVAGVGPQHELLVVGEAVAVGVDHGVGGIERVEAVGQLPVVRHAVAVAVEPATHGAGGERQAGAEPVEPPQVQAGHQDVAVDHGRHPGRLAELARAAAEAPQGAERRAVRRHHLHVAAEGVGDVEPAGRVDGEAAHPQHLARAGADADDGADEGAAGGVEGVDHRPGVGGGLGDPDAAAAVDRHVGRRGERHAGRGLAELARHGAVQGQGAHARPPLLHHPEQAPRRVPGHGRRARRGAEAEAAHHLAGGGVDGEDDAGAGGRVDGAVGGGHRGDGRVHGRGPAQLAAAGEQVELALAVGHRDVAAAGRRPAGAERAAG